MRAWLALTQAGARFERETVQLAHMQRRIADGEDGSAGADAASLSDRRALGSVHGLFPVLRVDGVPIHESLAICEYAADAFPEAGLWPADAVRRGQARAISCEMLSGFATMRSELSCHLFGRVSGFSPSAATLAEVARVFEIWRECLLRDGGPFLFGRFTIADAMYYPVLTRLRTYGVPIPKELDGYTHALETAPVVQSLVDAARSEPQIPVYDDYMRRLGGDPNAAL